MKINEIGQVIIDEDDLTEMLYSNKDYSDVWFFENDEKIKLFNEMCERFDSPEDMVSVIEQIDIDINKFHRDNQNNWDIPDEYFECPIEDFLYEKCRNDTDRERISLEIELFNEREMLQVLCVIKYIIDTLREHDIVWGVGRGSSVASLALYFIGVHSVDPIKYELDITEFLK